MASVLAGQGRRRSDRACRRRGQERLAARRQARIAALAAERSRAVAALKCCGGYLYDCPELRWWRCWHEPGCRDQWQPDLATWLPVAEQDELLAAHPGRRDLAAMAAARALGAHVLRHAREVQAEQLRAEIGRAVAGMVARAEPGKAGTARSVRGAAGVAVAAAGV